MLRRTRAMAESVPSSVPSEVSQVAAAAKKLEAWRSNGQMTKLIVSKRWWQATSGHRRIMLALKVAFFAHFQNLAVRPHFLPILEQK